ncbi:hypothetical protein PRNP1_012873 [Phytophthora ramorum]
MIELWRLLTLAAVIHAASGQTNGTQSGCEVCASTGDCSRAYHGTHGQLCGNWLDRQNERRPCCCPDDAVCKVSNYACNCGYAPYRAGDGGGGGLLWLWWFLGALALVLCCGGCCFMLSRRAKEHDADSAIPMAAPVSSPIPGGSSDQPYGTTAPYASAATPAYGRYYGRNGGSGMGAGTGAALGGAAGLLGGFLLGETVADHGDGGSFGDGGDGFDGGGGFDGGDFGGDF